MHSIKSEEKSPKILFKSNYSVVLYYEISTIIVTINDMFSSLWKFNITNSELPINSRICPLSCKASETNKFVIFKQAFLKFFFAVQYFGNVSEIFLSIYLSIFLFFYSVLVCLLNTINRIIYAINSQVNIISCMTEFLHARVTK